MTAAAADGEGPETGEYPTAGGHRLFVARQRGVGTPLVVLHGGLDSVSTLRDFPTALAEATGRPVLAYDRWGHGRAETLPVGTLRPDDNRQVEAATLLDLLDRLAVDRAVLVGHSDGGAIALLAAARSPGRVAGVLALAPQLVNHAAVQSGIADAVAAFERGSLRAALANHHSDVEGVFRGWSGVWRREVYTEASVAGELAEVACPVHVVTGIDDPYGFRPNLTLLAQTLRVPFEVSAIAAAGHLPHHSQRSTVIEAASRLMGRLDGVAGRA